MTAPWAEAEVDVTLNWDGVDDELVSRLSKSTEIAAKAVQKNFADLTAGAEKSLDGMADSYEKTSDTAVKSQKRIGDQASKTAKSVARARKAEADAADSVRVSETKLKVLRDKGVSDAGRIAAAEAAVAKAKRGHKIASDDLARAVKAEDASQKKASQSSEKAAKSTKTAADAKDRAARSADGLSGRLRSLTGAGDGAGSMLTGLAKKAGVAAAAFLGFQGIKSFLSAGWGRLTNIDNAAASLRGMGMDAQQVTGMMDQALKSVKGTSYGLDEAAKAAAMASAAGVKAGGDMDKYLGTVVNTAARAGTGLDEMAQIFGKVATSGKLGGEVIQQLGERGIAVIPMLAKHLGVAQGEVAALASKGKISFQQFRDAMEAGTAGAAEEQANTVQGAMSNLRAAMSRASAAMLEPLFSVMPKILGWLTGVVDNVTGVIGPAIERVKEMFSGMFSGLGDGGGLAAIGDRVREVFGTIVEAAQRWWDNIKGPLESVGRTIMEDVVPTLMKLGEIAMQIGGFLASAFEVVLPVIQTLGGYLQGTLATAFNVVAGVIGGVVTAITSVVDWLTRNKEIVAVVAGIITAAFLPALVSMAASFIATQGAILIVGTAMKAYAIGMKIAAVATKAFAVAQNLMKASLLTNPIFLVIAALVALGAGLVLAYKKSETFRNIVQAVWNAIKTAIGAVWDWISGTLWPGIQAVFSAIGDVVMWLWNNVMQPAWSAIQTIIGVWWAAVKIYFTAVITVFKAIGTVVMWLWQNVISPAFSAIGQIISVAWTVVSTIFTIWMSVMKVVGAVIVWLWRNVAMPAFQAIGAVLSAVWNSVIKPVWDLFQAAMRVVGAVVMWLWNNVVQPAMDGMGKVISWVWENVIRPAWEALKAGMEKVGEVIGTVVGWIQDRWEDFKVGFGLVKDKVGEHIDNVKKFFQGLWDKVKEIVEKIKKAVTDMGDKVKGVASKLTFGLIGGNALGGPVLAAYASGGSVRQLTAAAARTSSSTPIAPGSFIVNAKQTRENKELLQRIAPRGRVISGPGTTTSDSITGTHKGKATARVSRGEYYVPPEEAAGMMPLLLAINAGRMLGNMLAAGGLAMLAAGGSVGREPYGMPVGTNISYGAPGFPQWVYDIGDRFNVKPSTYAGHQERDGQNKGIDWSGSVSDMQKFAEFLLANAGDMEQVIWMNPETGEQIGVADGQRVGPGTSQPGYYAADFGGHQDHVHTRQSYSFGGGDSTAPGIDDTSGSLSTTSSSSSSTPIGSGIGASGSSGSSASWGNSGGGSKFNSAVDAKRGGLTPVWVENWPASIGGSGSGDLSTTSPSGADLSAGADGVPSSSDVDTIPLKKNPDGTYSSTDPEWDRLIQRESGGRPDIVQGIQDANSGGNEASGLFQIAKGTWSSNGGTKYAPTAGEATPEQQAEIAAKIFNDQGGSPWGSGAGQNFGREDEAKLRAGIQRAGNVPTTPEGNVPVEVTNLDDDDTTAPDLSTTAPSTDGSPDLSTGTPTTPETPTDPDLSTGTDDSAGKYEALPFGKRRADAWLASQDYGAQMQDVGTSAAKEILGEWGDLIGVQSYVDTGIDEMVALLRRIAERDGRPEFKLGDVVNINGAQPAETEDAATKGMTAVMDTYRGDA